ncbi:MAG: serine/threonine protein kinase [Myxococcales bacterium]|nr:serine/threonine protein kinase [Myxococcales bacterium]
MPGDPSGTPITRRVAPYRPTFDDPTVVSNVGHVDPHGGTLSGEFAVRYEARDSLGEGGMGTVQLCHDRRVGRDVAMKLVRAEFGTSAQMRERFIREARVQGQLEHPSIVPVYDIGEGPNGEAYFTMRRVKGLTLEAVLFGLQNGDKEITRRYSQRRLLMAFSNVCLTIAYAHSRGVVHRDLNPANIMLGDFGEVIVLDWGLAKLPGIEDATPASQRVSLPDLHGLTTRAGSVLGTPGYMPPEQIRGAERDDAKADIYALGSILFEIASLEPMHSGETVDDIFTSTLMGTQGRPSARAPHRNVPPELDELCLTASASDPAQRPTARAVHEAIERLLDGSRDTEARQGLAAERAAMAQVALAHSHLENNPDEAAKHRARAMREVTTALALDPSHQGATSTLVNLLAVPPKQLPPDAQHEVEAVEQSDLKHRLRSLGLGHLGWLMLVPLLFTRGVRSYLFLAIMLGLAVCLSAANLLVSRTKHVSRNVSTALCCADYLGVAAVSAVLGSWVLVPLLALAVLTMHMLHTRVRGANHTRMLIGAFGAMLLPLVLEWLGLFPQVASFAAGELVLRSWLADLALIPTTVGVVLFHTIVLLMVFGALSRTMDAYARGERNLLLHAWQLRQLIPDQDDLPNMPTLDSRPSERSPVALIG